MRLIRQGPLAVEKKQRTVTRAARITKNKEDLVKPLQVRFQNTLTYTKNHYDPTF